MSQKIYEMVTERIVQLLEAGVIPWRRPWRSGAAVNWTTQKPYRGINTLLLDAGEYATFKRITEAGGTVKKGAKGEIVVFWKWLEKENEDTGELEKNPFCDITGFSILPRNAKGLRVSVAGSPRRCMIR